MVRRPRTAGSRRLRARLWWLPLALAATAAAAQQPEASEPDRRAAPGSVFYVRQTVGDDANDGLSADTAWRGLSKLSRLTDGDAAYVGPGLYREQIVVLNKRGVRLIADPEGRFTGDPPGAVMLVGSDPLDESVFEPHTSPGVYRAHLPGVTPSGIVEMDGDQRRYLRARSTREHLTEGLTLLEVVAQRPRLYSWDQEAELLYIHTSDGRPPASHELELIVRGAGVSIVDSPSTTVVGFTVRHVGDGGIIFGPGAGGGAAIGNRIYGSRQGVRVNGAGDVLVAGNTLFGNENSGVYFLRQAADGTTIGNLLYDNAKGLRWSSRSDGGLASDNVAFGNDESGIAIENVEGARLLRNTLAGNGRTQLLVIRSDYVSEENCFAPGAEQLVAELLFEQEFPTLEGYRQATARELRSRQDDCGPLPARLDVHRLHAESQAYAAQARKLLEQPAPPAGPDRPQAPSAPTN